MNLLIIGSGGHAGVVIDAVQKARVWVIDGLIDETRSVGEMRHGYRIISRPEAPDAFAYHIAIGDAEVRERISKEREAQWANVFHPLSYQAGKVDCHGSFFGLNSVLGNNSEVGNFCILNTGAILEHDSTLGDYSHLAPGVVTGGRVHIGNRTFVGLGSMICHGVKIGDNCFIGMGSVVVDDLPDGTSGFGNPFKAR